MSTIAFFGCGNMGAPMAQNLLKAGFTVRVYDLNPALTAPLQQAGAIVTTAPADTIAGADTVITMLPHDAAVLGLYINGDAPVSGGVAGAVAGTLSFLCGGTGDDVERARPYLSVMGKNIMHAGPAGAGAVAKICNNMLLAVHMIGTCEALQMGVDNGLDPKVLSDILLKSSGRNWSLELYNPWPGVMDNVPASREYAGGFQVDLMNKDLSLAMEAALHSKSTTLMGALAKQLYGLHATHGNGKLDFSSIIKLLKH